MTPEEARQKIAELIDKYERETNRNQSEADVRANYIDWLFYYLGWNVWHESGQQTSYYREGYVRGAGFVDVGLEIAGQPVLFLEAKRFGTLLHSKERLGDRTTEEKQAFRYARTRRLPYVILTNFERLQVFNADHERLILSFNEPQEYIERLDELQRLSPDKVQAGSLPAWERQLEIKPIDEEFLASLQDWRLRLANTIYEHNADNLALRTDGNFDFSKLMAAVQRILDRLILIRYADDKEVLLRYDILESIVSYYRNLGAYAKRDHLMTEFINLSHMMDEYHNTTLFQARHICEQVFIPNKVLASIIEEMNNISFRKFTSDILGNTYETYLGTKLVLKNGIINSEERRDIRKAGGIFYTPPIVVHYIIENTLRHLLAELEKEYGVHAIEKAREIKVLDPACGSGSFLIYAYQVLADFYRRMNEVIEGERVKLLASGAGADMFQRLELFKQLPQPLLDYPHHILEKQLYGVDIDPEAAEIAAVNLTMQAFADTRREKLPLILNENIKVGNSLISGTEEELRGYFGDDWQGKKPFNWEDEFPQIMEDGGFDVVIGNPPYGSKKMLTAEEKAFIKEHTRCTGSNDIAEFFISRTAELLIDGGYHGFIVPKPLTYITSWQQIREFLAGQSIESLVDVSMAFEEVLLEQVILIFRKQPPTGLTVPVAALVGGQIKDLGTVGHQFFDKRIFPIYLTSEVEGLMRKLWRKSKQLSDIARIFAGVGGVTPYLTLDKSVKERECIRGGNIERFGYSNRPIFLLPEGYFTQRDFDEHALPRIICQDIVAHITRPQPHIKITATLDITKRLTHETVINIALKPGQESVLSLQYLLGLLNSKLISWYVYRFIFNCAVRTMHFRPGYADYVPIRRIDFKNPEEKKVHDDLVALVNRMLELNKRLAPIRNTPCNERDELQREIERTDGKIDNLVYDLYGLTEEEREIVDKETERGGS